MATSNELIRDELTRRQMNLLRLSLGLSNRIRRILRSSQAELRMQIEERVESIAAPRVRFGKLTTKRLRALNETITKILRPTFDDIRTLTRDELLELAQLEVQFITDSLNRNLPVLANINLPDSNTLRQLTLSRPFQGKLLRRWMQEFETGDRRRMMDAVRTGLVLGRSSTDIGRSIFGTVRQQGQDGLRRITLNGATAIAQTAVSHVTNQARQALYLANANLIPKELYVATLDRRTTDICKSLDGEVFPVGQGPTPPVHIRCRSLRVPFVDGAQAGTRPANATTAKLLEGLRGPERRRIVEQLVGPVPATQNYQTFLRNQTVDFQNDALGVTKGRLFRRGGLELDQFVDRNGRELTIKELRIREPEAFRQAGLQIE